MTIFSKLNEAREALNSSNNSKYIFSYDLNAHNGQKHYIVKTYNTIYRQIIKNKEKGIVSHFYESLESEKVKLYLDIDCPINKIPNGSNPNEYFEKIINESIELVNKKLNLYEPPRIIVLRSHDLENPHKLSGHIIYPDVLFKSPEHMKYFMAGLNNNELTESNIIDPRVYRKGAFRMMYCAKKSNDIPLVFHKSINYDKDNISDKQLWLDSTVRVYPDSVYYIKQIIPKKRTNLNRIHNTIRTRTSDNNDSKYFISLNEIKKYLDLINTDRADDYDLWIKIGFAIFGSNPNAYELWNEWSKNSYKYDEDVCLYKWSTFNKVMSGMGTIRHYANIDNPTQYGVLCNTIDERKFDSTKIHCRYLPDNTAQSYITNEDASTFHATIRKWQTDKTIKSLAIKSVYATGKTVLLQELVKRRAFKRILWVTHRQTLTNDIFGNFHELGFKSYLDDKGSGKVLSSDRLICQIESLKKIPGDVSKVEGILVNHPPKYDLVILDESESTLFHFLSPTIKEPRATFNLFLDIINKSKKVIAMDGDFFNRSYDFLKEVGKYITPPSMHDELDKSLLVIENTYKYEGVDMLFTDSAEYFYKKIEQEVDEGKNVAICSMSSKVAEEYYERLSKKGIKCLLHTSKTDDILKGRLKNVNEYWSQYQVVIFSPCIDAGVSFSVRNYFHRVYGILSDKSTVQRGFSQMTYRVRYPIETKFLVLTNGLPFKRGDDEKIDLNDALGMELDNEDLLSDYVPEMNGCYNYNDITAYLSEVMRYSFECDNTGPIPTLSAYDKNHIYNVLESKNAIPRYFIPILVKMMQDKGINVSFIKPIDKSENVSDNVINVKEKILNTPDITKKELDEYLKYQQKNEATSEQKAKISRKLMIKKFHLERVTMEFLEAFYGKTYVLDNLLTLIDDENINLIKEEGINYEETKIKMNNNFVRNIIKTLGYDNIFHDRKIKQEEFNVNMEKTVKDIIFKEKKCIFPSFDFTKDNFMWIYNKKTDLKGRRKTFLGWVNSILKNYGLKLTAEKNKKMVNRISSTFYLYKIIILNNITDFVYFDKIKNNSNLSINKSEMWNDVRFIDSYEYDFDDED